MSFTVPALRSLRTAVLVCLAALVAWPSAGHAQRLTLGVQAGATRSTLRPDDPSFGWRTGRLAGLTAAYELTSWLGADAEALYVEKGAAGPDVFDMRISYFELPLLLRLTSPRSAWGIAPLVQAGIAPARELACSGRTRPHYIPELPPPPPVPLECGTQRTERDDLGVVLGAGVHWRAGRRVELQATVRSTRGRRDIARGWDFVTTKNRSTAFLLSGAIRPQ